MSEQRRSENPPKFYAPYESDDEGAESDATDITETTTDTAARGLDDPRYAIVRAAGPAFNTVNEQLLYQRGGFGASYEPMTSNASQGSPLFKDPKKRIQSSLFSFKSANRDKQVYPTSSDFKLKLPRVYKNVTQIQLVQLSFQYFLNTIPDVSGLSSTIVAYLSSIGVDVSNCAQCFGNVSTQTGMGFQEFGRTHPAVGGNVPLTHVVAVRPGRYDVQGLAQELDYQMNKTPPFNMISYSDHRSQFRSTRNLYHLFNEGGRYFHNKLKNEFHTGFSKTDIHDHYFGNNGNNLQVSTIPTDQETFVAYYYPVLREALLSPYDHLFLDFLGTDLETVKRRVLNHFEGLDSTFYYSLCASNLPYLKRVRDQHTFAYNPINQYDWSYDPGMQRFIVKHTDLHPSIQTELTNAHTTNHQNALGASGLSSGQFSTLQVNHTKTKAILTDLTKALDTALTKVGIVYGGYSPAYVSQSANVVKTSALLMAGHDSPNILESVAIGAVSVPTYAGEPLVTADFGWTSLTQLQTNSVGGVFPVGYQNALTNMNTAAASFSTFGAGYIQGFPGSNISLTGYSDLYSTFVGYYSTYVGQGAVLSNVTYSRNAATSNYFGTKYGSIFGTHLLNNNAFLNGNGTGGVKFLPDLLVKPSTPHDVLGAASGSGGSNKCCDLINAFILDWYGCLPANYVVNTLPWKLGFTPTISNTFQFFSNVGSSTTTTPFNIYLQLNIEQSLNNMDVAMNENFSVTNLPTSENKVVLGKMLTEGSGLADVTQTIVQSPAQFITPIAKLDNLHFTLLLDDLTPISKIFPFAFGFTEWDGIVQIDEEVGVLDRETQLSSVPQVQLPTPPYEGRRRGRREGK